MILLMVVIAGCEETKKEDFDESIEQTTHPNIIFIMADDLGWSDLSAYGSDFYETPNLDNLATKGIKFTNAYASAPVCSPTRASFLTGKPPAVVGITEHLRGREFVPTSAHAVIPPENGKGLALEEVTIAELLKNNGYNTGIVGKWHVGKDSYIPRNQGFEYTLSGNYGGGPGNYFYPYANTKPDLLDGGRQGEYLTDRLTDEAIEFINDQKDNSFFLYMSYYSPHIPLQAKANVIAKYNAKAPGSIHTNSIYAAMLETLDDNIGKLIRHLEKLSLAENTIIIFTSDHGGLSTIEGANTPATVNHPFRAGKGYLYEGGLRVPLIVNWPGRVAPSVNDTPLTTYDFFPTLAGIASVNGNLSEYGIDFSQTILHGNPVEERPLYWHAPHYSNQGGKPASALREGKYKLIHFYEDDTLELYDLEQDLDESDNLAENLPEIRDQLFDKLKAWLNQTNAKLPIPNPEYGK